MTRKTVALLFGLSALGVIAIISLLILRPAGGPGSQGGLQRPIEIGGPFSLRDQNGETRHLSDFEGKFVLLNFGYTFCPDVCPTSLQDMSAAIDLLGDRGNDVVPVFITIDPARDTVEQLKSYIPHFHPRLVGLTGTAEDIRKTAKDFRIYYARSKIEADEGEYLMDHSSLFYLLGPDGKFVRHFSYGTTAQEMAQALKDLLPEKVSGP